MAKNSLNDWSTTVGNNTDIAGTSIAVGCPPQDVGVFMRTAMAQIAYAVQGSGGTIPTTWNTGTLISTAGTFTAKGTAGNQAVNFSQFAPTAATSGHIDLPGGVTVNWGQGTGPSASVTFHKAFSSNPWNIQATPAAVASTGATGGVQVTSTVSASAATIVTVSSAGVGVSMQFYYIAIGPT